MHAARLLPEQGFSIRVGAVKRLMEVTPFRLQPHAAARAPCHYAVGLRPPQLPLAAATIWNRNSRARSPLFSLSLLRPFELGLVLRCSLNYTR
jgi:hypothetical protein